MPIFYRAIVTVRMDVIIISTAFELHIKEFKSWLEEETDNVLRPLNARGKKLVDKLEKRFSDVRETCEKLAEEGTKQIEKGKAVRKAKVTEKLSRYFLKQIGKIAFPDKISFSELEKLNKDLEKTLSSITRERKAWFPRISPLFIIARKRVDFSFSRLAGSISEFDSFLSSDYSKAKVLEKLFLETDEVMRFVDDLGKYGERRAGIETKIQFLQKKIEESEETSESIRGSVELRDLAEIDRKVQHLKKQVRTQLRHFKKPFIKFANLIGAPGYALTSEEVEKLNQYVEDPFVALATEAPDYPTLKSILKKIERAIDRGTLKLKSSRLRKCRNEITAILAENTLDKLYQDCAKAFSSSQQLTSSEETQVAQKKSKQLQERLEKLRKRKEAAAARLDALERRHDQLVKKVADQKKMLEQLVYELLEKHVNLKF